MNSRTPLGAGIIGCGNIFTAYARGLTRLQAVRIIGCADVDPARAKASGAEHGVMAYPTVANLLADDRVDIVVNLTPPLFHASVTTAALGSGKHVYTEKPLAATFAEGRDLLRQATELGLIIGSAPDTFLGSSGQTTRAVVDSGTVGEIVGASAFVTHSHAEHWHPDPTFLFKAGAGPSLDMGPYYIAAMVNVLGPVQQVYSRSRVGAAVRPVTTPGRLVDSIDVEIPTHCAAVLTFTSGTIATVMMSFDVWNHELPHMELYGTLGTLSVPDPDKYDDPVRVRLHSEEDWRKVEPVIESLTGDLPENEQLLRGPGVADLAAALGGGPQRCSGELALHVLEVLETIASGDGTPRHMTTTCQRPAAVTQSTS